MSNQVRVQQHPTGQLTVTLPRALAQALSIRKGDVMEWTLEDGKLLLIKAKK
jgi:antitoxin component of MazEF toxin-antitoxin module